jgi:uncharacterized protein (DUF58 family)
MPTHHPHRAIGFEPLAPVMTKLTALSKWPGIFLRWFYQNRSLRLTSEGLRFVMITFAVGIAALNTGNNLLYLLLAMMLALIVVSGVLSEKCLKGLNIQRRLPPHLFAGEPATVALRVTNEKRHFPSFSLRISDVIVGAAQFAATHLLYLPPKGSTVHSYRLLFPKRGQFRVEATRVSTRFPFGLFVKIATLPNQAEMVAYPAPKPLPPAILDALETIGHDREASRRGLGSGLYNLRDYHVGDDTRSVHWKTSARQSRLVVRETEAEDQRQVTLALASEAPVGMRALTLTAIQDFERAVILTASLAAHFQRQGFAIRLVIGNEEVCLGTGQGHFYRILRLLAFSSLSLNTGAPIPSSFLTLPSDTALGQLVLVILPWEDERLRAACLGVTRILDLNDV